MQTKYLCVLIHIWINGEVGAPLNRFKPSSKIFYWPFQGGTSFVDLLCFCSVLCLLCLCVSLFICALWSPAGKGLTSWLSFMVSNCEFVTFPLVSWVGCGTWLYRLLIFAPLLTLIKAQKYSCHLYVILATDFKIWADWIANSYCWRSFIDINTLRMRAAKPLARLRICLNTLISYLRS